MSQRNYWLFKSEPANFSFDDLRTCPDSTEHWDGVRNYQARNYLRDEVQVGDQVLFYHSNIAEPAIVALPRLLRPDIRTGRRVTRRISISIRRVRQRSRSGTWWMCALSNISPGRSSWRN